MGGRLLLNMIPYKSWNFPADEISQCVVSEDLLSGIRIFLHDPSKNFINHSFGPHSVLSMKSVSIKTLRFISHLCCTLVSLQPSQPLPRILNLNKTRVSVFPDVEEFLVMLYGLLIIPTLFSSAVL
jgi:hypothetical protein